MSRPKSWKKSFQPDTELAIATVRECVKALRSRGLKTDVALVDLAQALDTTPRRVRTLFHRDGDPIVLKNEWLSLRYRAGLFFLNEAQRLRALADHYEMAGEDLVASQLEVSWEQPWSKNGPQRRSA